MSLVVPQAPTVVGRTAAARVEAPQLGGALAEAGNQMFAFGTALEDDRLDRQMARLKVDMTRDLGELRLQVEDMGDPDAAGAAWDRGVSGIREQYQTGIDDAGRPRIDPKNAENFGLVFDDLTNSHALALGGRFLGLRQSQRAATYSEYQRVAGIAAAGAPDVGTRARLYGDFDEDTDHMVAIGALTPEEGMAKKQEFRRQTDSARAIEMLGRDPSAFTAALDKGDFGNLDAETRARLKVSADSEIARRAAADQKAAETAARERAAKINAQLGKIIDISDREGAIALDPAFMASPEVQASPRYAEAQAALSLRAEVPDLPFKTPAQIDALIAEEKTRSITEPWQKKRLEVLETQRQRAADGWRTDGIAYARKAGFAVPDLPAPDSADPQAYADALAARVTFGAGLKDQGYTGQAVYLDRQEQSDIKAALDVATDPARRAALGAAITGAVIARGGNPALIEGLTADPVLAWTSGGMARGAIPEGLAIEILAGQQAMKAQNVVMPSAKDRLQPVFAQIGTLFTAVPGGDRRQAEVMAAADALYARRSGQIDPSDDFDEEVYQQALHEVMGGTGPYGSSAARGGVQEVEGRLTALDPGIGAEDVEATLTALSRHRTAESGTAVWMKDYYRFPASSAAALTTASRSGGMPVINGEHLSPGDLSGAGVQALGADAYVLILPSGQTAADSTTGQPWVFSLARLMREYGR